MWQPTLAVGSTSFGLSLGVKAKKLALILGVFWAVASFVDLSTKR